MEGWPWGHRGAWGHVDLDTVCGPEVTRSIGEVPGGKQGQGGSLRWAGGHLHQKTGDDQGNRNDQEGLGFTMPGVV